MTARCYQKGQPSIQQIPENDQSEIHQKDHMHALFVVSTKKNHPFPLLASHIKDYETDSGKKVIGTLYTRLE